MERGIYSKITGGRSDLSSIENLPKSPGSVEWAEELGGGIPGKFLVFDS